MHCYQGHTLIPLSTCSGTPDVSRYQVVFGMQYVDDFESGLIQAFTPTTRTMHEDFNNDFVSNDIAIFRKYTSSIYTSELNRCVSLELRFPF